MGQPENVTRWDRLLAAMRKGSQGWRGATALVLGVIILGASACVALFGGREYSTLIIVGALLIAGGLLFGLLPDDAKLSKIALGPNGVEIGFATQTARTAGDIRELTKVVESVLDGSVDESEGLRLIADQLRVTARTVKASERAAVDSLLESFKTQYFSHRGDPYGDPSISRHGWWLSITGVGRPRPNLTEFFEVYVRLEGPNGWSFQEGSFEGNYNYPHQTPVGGRSYIESVPEGSYVATWYLRSAAGDELEIRTDKFSVPTVTPYHDMIPFPEI